METRFQNFPATLETGQIKKEMKRWYAARGNEEHWSTCEKDILATLSPWDYPARAFAPRPIKPAGGGQDRQVTANPVSSKPLARRTLRVADNQAFSLCVEPSFLEHNGGIVTCCFSQRYLLPGAVVKRSNSKSTIGIPIANRHPPQTRATHLKRLYRNCPPEMLGLALSARGSPDRVLTVSRNSSETPRPPKAAFTSGLATIRSERKTRSQLLLQ